MDITINIISLILLFIFSLIVYKYLETFWSYKVYKPYLWEEAVKQGRISKKLKSLERTYYDKIRLYSMWFQIERIKRENIKGDFAELGVHKGETARFIYEMSTTQKLYLFDTFEGFNEKDLQHEATRGGKYTTAEFSDTSAGAVKKLFDGDSRVSIHPGYFPGTATGLENNKFSFVHLDADLYLPTLEALKFFYPRLSPGGVIIVHDYNHTWPGIKKAFDEFMPTIPESLLELPDWKGSVMIVKNK
jgi:O-methyltransferase